jgi:hypothetical protein
MVKICLPLPRVAAHIATSDLPDARGSLSAIRKHFAYRIRLTVIGVTNNDDGRLERNAKGDDSENEDDESDSIKENKADGDYNDVDRRKWMITVRMMTRMTMMRNTVVTRLTVTRTIIELQK